MLEKIFNGYKLEAEIREIEQPDEKKLIGSIMYFLNLPLNISTDNLNDKILALPNHVEGIEWAQPKHTADIYQ